MRVLKGLEKNLNPVELVSKEGFSLSQFPALAGISASILLFPVNPALMTGIALANIALFMSQLRRKQVWREAIRAGKLVKEVQKAADQYIQYLTEIQKNLIAGISIPESLPEIERNIESYKRKFDELIAKWEKLERNKALEGRITSVTMRSQLKEPPHTLPKDAQLILSLEQLGKSVAMYKESMDKNKRIGEKIENPVRFFNQKVLEITQRLSKAQSADIEKILTELGTLKSEIERFGNVPKYGEQVKKALTNLVTTINEVILGKSVPSRKAQLEAEKKSKESLEEKTKKIAELREKILEFAALSEEEQFIQFDNVLEGWISLVRKFRVENDNPQSELSSADKRSLAQTFENNISEVFKKYLQPIIDSRNALSAKILERIKRRNSRSLDLQRLESKITELRTQGKIAEDQKDYLLKQLRRKKQIVEGREQIINGKTESGYVEAIKKVFDRLKEPNISVDELIEYENLLEDWQSSKEIRPEEKVQLITARAKLKEKRKIIEEISNSGSASVATETTETTRKEVALASSAELITSPQKAEIGVEFDQEFTIPLFLESYRDDAKKLLLEWESLDRQDYSQNREKIKWAWYHAVYCELKENDQVKKKIDDLVGEWAKAEGNPSSYRDENAQKMQQGWATKVVVEKMLARSQGSESEAETAPAEEAATTPVEEATEAAAAPVPPAETAPAAPPTETGAETGGTETAPATPAEEVSSSESKKEFDAAKAQKEVGEMLSEWEETDDQNYSENDEKIKWAWYQAVYEKLQSTDNVKGQIDDLVETWAKAEGNTNGSYPDKNTQKMQQGWATKEVVEEMLKGSQVNESEESTAPVAPAETGTGGETAAAAETPPTAASPAPATSPEADLAKATKISSSRTTEVINKNLTGTVKFNAMEMEKKQATLDEIANVNPLFQDIRLGDVVPSIEQINLNNKGQITKIVISPKANFSKMGIGKQSLTFGGSGYHNFDNENKNIEISVSYEGSNVKVAVTSAQDRNITVDSLVLECNPNDTVSLVFAQDDSLVSIEGVVRDFPNGILGLILGEEKKERSDDLISFLQNNYKKRVRFEYTRGSLGKIILWQNILSKLLAVAGLSRPVQNELRNPLTALGLNEFQNQSAQRISASDLIISVKPKQSK